MRLGKRGGGRSGTAKRLGLGEGEASRGGRLT